MFEGVYTALVTPFKMDGSIDETALRKLVQAQVEAGVQGLVPMGTTGESPTVSHEENLRVIEIVIEEARGRVPVIAGTGSNSTQEAIDMTFKAKEMGAAASLQVAPYYNKPNQEGFFRHFQSIADAVDLPLIVYNIPGRTAKNVETETIVRLSQHPRIVGIKEASGSVAQVMDVIAQVPADFSVLSGDDNWTLPLMALGGHGVISVASHLIPGEMVSLCRLMSEGKLKEAQVIHYKILRLCKALFLDTNPIPLKYALSRLGVVKEAYRLPLIPLANDLKGEVDAALVELGLLKAFL